MTDIGRRQPAVSTASVSHVLEQLVWRNRKMWSSFAVSGVLNPVVMMLALGFGLGSQIDDTSSLGTDDYLLFVGPGVLAGTAMLQGGFYSLWPTLSSLRWEGTYKAMVRTPASPADVAIGHLLWVAIRVGLSSALYTIVLLPAVGWVGAAVVLAPFVAALTAAATAAMVSAFSSRAESEASFSLVSRMVITPLFVFSGTFTAVDALPDGVAALIRLTPGYHGIEICRTLFNGAASVPGTVGHATVLAAWATIGTVLTITGFSKNLAA